MFLANLNNLPGDCAKELFKP